MSYQYSCLLWKPFFCLSKGNILSIKLWDGPPCRSSKVSPMFTFQSPKDLFRRVYYLPVFGNSILQVNTAKFVYFLTLFTVIERAQFFTPSSTFARTNMIAFKLPQGSSLILTVLFAFSYSVTIINNQLSWIPSRYLLFLHPVLGFVILQAPSWNMFFSSLSEVSFRAFVQAQVLFGFLFLVSTWIFRKSSANLKCFF